MSSVEELKVRLTAIDSASALGEKDERASAAAALGITVDGDNAAAVDGALRSAAVATHDEHTVNCI